MEALILYFVIFFPGITTSSFSSAVWLLNRTLGYTLPALALLWYIVLGKKSFRSLISIKFQKKDLLTFAACLAGLIIIGLGISLIITLVSRHYGLPIPPGTQAPDAIFGWIIMVISCICTGYLEESYFRFYLLTKYENYPISYKVVFSTLLFAFGHAHDGPWGILNAVLAGIFLSIVFIRYKTFHGIALAHGFYNIFVYTIGIFL